jgi:hypothetical protein
MYHPDVVLTHAYDRQRELIAQGERHRLISAIRRRGRAKAVARGRPTAATASRGVAAATPA